MSPIRAVWFDVGEALINETREYDTWADWLGIPRHTFSAVFSAVIARGEDYREVFRYFRPDFDLEAAGRPGWTRVWGSTSTATTSTPTCPLPAGAQRRRVLRGYRRQPNHPRRAVPA